jgi:hypothetical protein
MLLRARMEKTEFIDLAYQGFSEEGGVDLPSRTDPDTSSRNMDMSGKTWTSPENYGQ